MLKVENLIKKHSLLVASYTPMQRPIKKLRQTSKTKISAKVLKGIQSLTVFAKNSIPEVWRGS